MTTSIVERISRTAEVPELCDILANRIEPTDIQPLLLSVSQERAEKVTPAALLRQYQQNRFVQPAAPDPK